MRRAVSPVIAVPVALISQRLQRAAGPAIRLTIVGRLHRARQDQCDGSKGRQNYRQRTARDGRDDACGCRAAAARRSTREHQP
jgi:hypothetical protein